MNEITTIHNPPDDAGMLLASITAAAGDHKTDLVKMERMVALYKELKADQAKSAYTDALTRFTAQKQVIATNRTGDGPGGSSYAYADWPQMESAIRPWLVASGLTLTHRQDPPVIEAGQIKLVMVYAILRHRDGHSEEASFPAIPNLALAGKLSPAQLIQQPITYAKRQTAAMILGLSTREDAKDDDSVSVGVIDADQLSTLLDLLSAWDPSPDDRARLLAWAKVTDIEQLPAKSYPGVAIAIKKKIAQKVAA